MNTIKTIIYRHIYYKHNIRQEVFKGTITAGKQVVLGGTRTLDHIRNECIRACAQVERVWTVDILDDGC